MGLKMGVFFEIGDYKGLDLRGSMKQGECLLPEGTFSGTFRNLRELFFISNTC
jgi:hypothetical protein